MKVTIYWSSIVYVAGIYPVLALLLVNSCGNYNLNNLLIYLGKPNGNSIFFCLYKCPVKKFEVKGIARSKEPKKKKFATGVSLKN